MWWRLALFGDFMGLSVICQKANLFGRGSQHKKERGCAFAVIWREVTLKTFSSHVQDSHEKTAAREGSKVEEACPSRQMFADLHHDITGRLPGAVRLCENSLALQCCLGRPDGTAVDSHDCQREIRLKKVWFWTCLWVVLDLPAKLSLNMQTGLAGKNMLSVAVEVGSQVDSCGRGGA